MEGFSDGIGKAIGYLVIAGIAYFAYQAGKDNAGKTKNIWLFCIKGLAIIAGIALFANSLLGTHSENCDDDPIYGRCDTVQDYEPSPKDYSENFIYYIIFLGIPFLIGTYNGYKKGPSEDSKSKDNMTLEEADKIVRAYGKVVEETSQQSLEKYPSMHYPISLLPYPKEKITEAIDLALLVTDDGKEDNYTTALKSTRVMLDYFIDDEEANKKNSELVNNEAWQKAVKDKKKK